MYTGVLPQGAYVEERLVAAEKLVKIPEGVDDVTAAAIALKGMTTQVLLRKVFKVDLFLQCLSALSKLGLMFI